MASSDEPRRRLSTSLRRGRKDHDRSDSSTSVAVDEGASGLKPSLDGAFAKIKDRARKSLDDRRNSDESAKGLSRLMHSSKRSSRRKSSTQELDDKNPTAWLSASGDLDPNRARGTSPSPSELSLGLHGSGHSSLLTEDSDDQSAPTRPTLSPHQSHAGYLTLSSPLINATTTQHPLDQPRPQHPLDQPQAQHPLDQVDQDPAETLASPSSPTKSDSAAPERRQTPAERLKGAFTLPKKKSQSDIVTNTQEVLPNVQLDPETITSAPRPFTPPTLSQPTPTIITTTPSTPPNTVSPPTTFVTPPTPTSPPSGFTQFSSASAPSLNFGSASLNAAAQRRKRAGTFTSSKLSTGVNVPLLTPHIEEAKTPGGTVTAPPGSSGFFSSVFSAAQNAANQITNTLNTNNSPNSKQRSQSLQQTEAAGGEEVIPGPDAVASPDLEGAKRQLAVETLGSGDLSLDQLGITLESADISPMNSNSDLGHASPRLNSSTSSNTQKQDESAAAQRAVSAAYEKPVERAVSQATGGRPGSVLSNDGSDAGFQTPPRGSSTFDTVKRSGSVRSKISGRRRHRGSSAATGGSALAAAITASTSTLTNPGANGPGHRTTGFAVASSKRNKDFHQLFRSVPEDDYLIEDYSAALQRDILLHGRLYVSEGHICFSSNILGWVTNLVISFDEVVSVEKKNTAVIFPNAIIIQTLHARNVFASLVARESTYDLIVGIWKINHPNLKSSLQGVAVDNAGTGDKTERAESLASGEETDQPSDDDVYDEDEDEEDVASYYEPGSTAGSEIGDATISRKTSGIPMTAGQPSAGGSTKALEVIEAAAPSAAASADFPGPATHAPTDCGDQDTHYDRPLVDTTIAAPLGKVYSLMWGPASVTFMKKWLVDDQKSRELSYEAEKGGMDDTHRTFTYTYIKPLSAPVGPRQTKCIVTATMEQFDLEKAVVVNCSTATPDVPSGNIFTTKTKYCMMWGPGNSTRFIATCTVEWTGKSWLKGAIDKGANDGQIQYVKDLTAALRAAVVAKAVSKSTVRGKGKGKGRRKNDVLDAASDVERTITAVKFEEAHWGLFEPFRGLLEPIVSIISPLFSTQIIIPILVLLLAYTWLFPSRSGSKGLGFPIDSPGRLAAYEEIWRREESELWDWLEDRVGLSNGVPVHDDSYRKPNSDRQKVLNINKMGRRLKGQGMEEGQVQDAIRVTEERLQALKEAVEKKKDHSKKDV